MISRCGPSGLTIAEVAGEVGLAPATIVQRFESKRKLLLALAASGAAGVQEPFDSARQDYDSPLEALEAGLAGMASFARTPGELANHLAFLQLDIRDPDFHTFAREHARGMRRAIQGLLDQAQAAGEIGPCDTSRLARSVEVAYNGAMITWAVHREGSAAAWLQEELDALLAPYRPSSA